MINLADLAELNGLIAALLSQQVNGKLGKGILETYSKCSNFAIDYRSEVLIFAHKQTGFRITIDVADQIQQHAEGAA